MLTEHGFDSETREKIVCVKDTASMVCEVGLGTVLEPEDTKPIVNLGLLFCCFSFVCKMHHTAQSAESIDDF